MARKSADKSERRISKRQANRLAEISGLSRDDIVDLSVEEVDEVLVAEGLWHLFGYRRICGRVVKRHPGTGELLAVPGATVEVEDTDCTFLTYAPGGGLMWIYPGICEREIIATTVTDACGNFCVWVPRWELDWILRWRRERICFPLKRPRLVDYVDPLPDPPIVREPGWIDPVPEIRLTNRITERFGPGLAERISLQSTNTEFGAIRAVEHILEEPAPTFPPPQPDRSPEEVIGYIPDPLGPVDWSNWIGPFVICHEVHVPEWSISKDVPDITFKVTQEIGGSDVVIYSEGLFDVRWDDSGPTDAVLEASQAALAVETCHGPDIECEDVPAITAASFMPLTPAYHDDTTGFGLRVNRPSFDGETQPGLPLLENAESPIADRLDLFGCAHMEGASHYRIVYSFEGGPQLPLTGFSWPARRASDGAVIHITPDADGWIQLQDLLPPWDHLLTSWPTQRSLFGNGSFELVLETGAPGGSANQTGDPRVFLIDNTYPHWDVFSVEYRVGSGPWDDLDLGDCPKIIRGPMDQVRVKLTWQASADHLRQAFVGFAGCSASSAPVPITPSDTRRWWWQKMVGSKTTTNLRVAEWVIDPSDEAGCYTLAGSAFGRAYNPAVPGMDLSNDYFGFENRRRVHKREAISIVDSTT